eukprot:COSAG06_NODE_6788_length_2781_cov_3.424310_1_plen_787_part_00
MQLLTTWTLPASLLLLMALHAHARAAARLDLHLCPHSHLDVGFDWTPDTMFSKNASGANKIDGPGKIKSVGLVLDSVVAALQQDAQRTYNIAEIFYLDLYLASTNSTQHETLFSLVKEGRFNFMNAGWCQNDEASVHVDGIIDQHTLGHLFLRSKIGDVYTPSVGWQVDPFGHSAGHAWVLYNMGFDTSVTGRIGGKHVNAGNALWTPFAENGATGTLMNNIHGGYSDINPSACSNLNGGKQITDASMPDYARAESEIHNTTVALAAVGGDVCWITATSEYIPYDQAIAAVVGNESLGIIPHYSSPDRWAAALHNANETFEVMPASDEFPYGDWVGNFVTRPLFKRHIRSRHALFHAANRMAAALPLAKRLAASAQLNQMWKAVSVVQHHDSITGTATPYVFPNYNAWLQWGGGKASSVMAGVVASSAAHGSGQWGGALCDEEYAGKAGVLICNVLQTPLAKNTSMQVFNPLGWPVNATLVLKTAAAAGDKIDVVDAAGASVPAQAVGDGGSISFRAVNVPPLGYSSFTLLPSTSRKARATKQQHWSSPTVIIENEFLRLSFGSTTGALLSITDKTSDITSSVECQLGYFNSTAGDMFAWTAAAGTFKPLVVSDPQWNVHGEVFKEVLVSASDGSGTTVGFRLNDGAAYLEVNIEITPQLGSTLPTERAMVAARFVTNITSNGTFFTDSNGMGLLKRQAGAASHSTFPAVAYSLIHDTQQALFVLNDRAQGVQSVSNGSLDVLIYDNFDIDPSCGGAGCGGPKNQTDRNVATQLWCEKRHFCARCI